MQWMNHTLLLIANWLLYPGSEIYHTKAVVSASYTPDPNGLYLELIRKKL